ncbi:hypothetical protein L596_002477 [Steinernema carpocapsae]|uniref:EB domain-containing protein n=1 Tax=Steinernema carpocapsae TaxID=34508 RepID=A0A4U8UTA2_STECR|nr:hypothetical protein L596_002477 [Steinernema carpocapsae]
MRCRGDKATTGEVSCANRFARVERVAGQVRVCDSRNDHCSEGYSCQRAASPFGGTMACCSSALALNPKDIREDPANDSPPFRCPHPGQVAVFDPRNPGENLYCQYPGQMGKCPPNAACQSAANSIGLNICCYGSVNYPTCPYPRIPQPSPLGYVPCDMTNPNECAYGYTCQRSASDYSDSLCCSLIEVRDPTCPNQQALFYDEGRRPKYCNPTRPMACPDNYICVAALGHSRSFVCCSSPSSTICPSDYSPSVDRFANVILCSMSDQSMCPDSSSCLESQNHPGRFLCCRSSLAPRVCPNDQNALVTSSGTLEYCTGPGITCSRSGYSCQMSPSTTRWVCCGRDQPMAVCADGRETYFQSFGVSYECNPLVFPSDCPPHYDCSYSNIRGISVCCKTTVPTVLPPVVKLSCPSGWNPYQTSSGVEHCQNVMDTGCPNGFSCVQSSQIGTFICCRIASSPQCPAGGQALYVNNQPRTCTKSGPQSCPVFYTCMQSTMGGIHICCSIAPNWDDELKCLADGSRPEMLGDNIKACHQLGQSEECPFGTFCSRSTRPEQHVCCRRPISNSIRKAERNDNVCGRIGFAYRIAGRLVECSDNANLCPMPYECQPSLTNTKMYCCSEARCPVNPPSGEPTRCYSDDDCLSGTTCQQSENIAEMKLCCPSTETERALLSTKAAVQPTVRTSRCLHRATQMTLEGSVACSSSQECSERFECTSQTTSKERLCCAHVSETTTECPENRCPFRSPSTDDLFFCDKTDFACPVGFMCKRARPPLESRHICCSPIAFCRLNGTPLIDASTNQPKRCFHDHHCGSDGAFGCVESTVNGVTVCCKDENVVAAERWIVLDG